MKILALDIGAGTQDILLYDDEKKSVENCIKIVLPSPSQILAAKVREATQLCQDLYIKVCCRNVLRRYNMLSKAFPFLIFYEVIESILSKPKCPVFSLFFIEDGQT